LHTIRTLREQLAEALAVDIGRAYRVVHFSVLFVRKFAFSGLLADCSVSRRNISRRAPGGSHLQSPASHARDYGTRYVKKWLTVLVRMSNDGDGAVGLDFWADLLTSA